jgi:hypothetical protein
MSIFKPPGDDPRDKGEAHRELERRNLNQKRDDPVDNFERACDKIQACQGELSHFSDAAIRAQSATGTILIQRNVIAPDARLGADRRKEQKRSAKLLAKLRREAAEKEHKLWIEEAQHIWAVNRYLSAIDAALEIRCHMRKSAKVETIRKVIAVARPPKHGLFL